MHLLQNTLFLLEIQGVFVYVVYVLPAMYFELLRCIKSGGKHDCRWRHLDHYHRFIHCHSLRNQDCVNDTLETTGCHHNLMRTKKKTKIHIALKSLHLTCVHVCVRTCTCNLAYLKPTSWLSSPSLAVCINMERHVHVPTCVHWISSLLLHDDVQYLATLHLYR